MKQDREPDPSTPNPETSRQDRRSLLRGLITLGAAFGALPALGDSLLVRKPEVPVDASGECPTTLTKSRSVLVMFTGSVPATFTASGVGQPPPSGGNTETYTSVNQTAATATHTEVWPAPGGGTQPVTIAQSFTISSSPSGGQTITYSWKGNSFTQTLSRQPTKWSLTYTQNESVSYTSTTPCDDKDDEAGGTPAPVELPNFGQQGALESLDLSGTDLFDPHARGESVRALSLGACGASRGPREQPVRN